MQMAPRRAGQLPSTFRCPLVQRADGISNDGRRRPLTNPALPDSWLLATYSGCLRVWRLEPARAGQNMRVEGTPQSYSSTATMRDDRPPGVKRSMLCSLFLSPSPRLVPSRTVHHLSAKHHHRPPPKNLIFGPALLAAMYWMGCRGGKN